MKLIPKIKYVKSPNILKAPKINIWDPKKIRVLKKRSIYIMKEINKLIESFR